MRRFAGRDLTAVVALVCACSSSGGPSGGSGDGGAAAGSLSCGNYLYTCGCGDPSSHSASEFGTPSPTCSPATFKYPAACCSWGGGSTGECLCAAYVCSDYGGGTCRCDWGPGYDTTTGVPAGSMSFATSCTGATCCEDSPSVIAGLPLMSIGGACICSGSGPCGSGQVQVDHCGQDNPPVACPGAATSVASCQ